jgi:hypothetical protein
LLLRDAPARQRKPGEVFPPGETLVYEVQWEPPIWIFFVPPITAGEIEAHFQEQYRFEERAAHRITAKAVSSGPFPRLTGISVSDSFESVVDAERFCSMKMTKKLREGKRLRDVFLTFDAQTRSGRYEAYDVSKSPRIQLKNEELTNLPECVQDVLSAIFFTRLQELAPGIQFPITIGDDGRVKPIEVRVLQKEQLEVLGRKIPALKLEAKSVFGGLFKEGGIFFVWFSDDKQKLPLQFEARVKLGKVSGFLKQIKQEESSVESSKTP